MFTFRNNIKYQLALTSSSSKSRNETSWAVSFMSLATVLPENSTISTFQAASSHSIPWIMALAAGRIRSSLTACGFCVRAIWYSYKGHLHSLGKGCFLLKRSWLLIWPLLCLCSSDAIFFIYIWEAWCCPCEFVFFAVETESFVPSSSFFRNLDIILHHLISLAVQNRRQKGDTATS